MCYGRGIECRRSVNGAQLSMPPAGRSCAPCYTYYTTHRPRSQHEGIPAGLQSFPRPAHVAYQVELGVLLGQYYALGRVGDQFAPQSLDAISSRTKEP